MYEILLFLKEIGLLKYYFVSSFPGGNIWSPNITPGPEVIKAFVMLNSNEHGISIAHKQ